MPEIVTVGETMAAFTPRSTGFLRYVRDYEMRIAGAESNLAIGVTKLGHTAGFVTGLGKDEFGEFVRNFIRSEGVDTEKVSFDDTHRTGVMFKQVLSASETSVFYYRENSAASHMDVSCLDEGYIKDSRILHMTGITPVLSPSCREMTEAAFYMAAQNHVDISFDPNVRKKLWKEKDYSELLRSLMEQAQIVLLGADEAELLLGTREPRRVMDLLFGKGTARLVAVKDGAKGAVVGAPNMLEVVPAFPCRCIDPVGAGDAFNAAFLCGVLEGKPVAECGKMGAVAGALATETYGDIEGYPSRERIHMALTGQNVIYR